MLWAAEDNGLEDHIGHPHRGELEEDLAYECHDDAGKHLEWTDPRVHPIVVEAHGDPTGRLRRIGIHEETQAEQREDDSPRKHVLKQREVLVREDRRIPVHKGMVEG